VSRPVAKREKHPNARGPALLGIPCLRGRHRVLEERTGAVEELIQLLGGAAARVAVGRKALIDELTLLDDREVKVESDAFLKRYAIWTDHDQDEVRAFG